jgi:hypothetical protein
MDQSIDHDLAELDEQSNQIEIVAAEVSLRR